MPSTKRTGAMLPDGLTRYSDLAVMLPAAGVIAVWLLAGRSPRALLAWLVTLGACYLPVVLSKLAFKGWGFGIRALDLTVISGQAMNATLMLVVLTSLLARQIRPAWRWPAALAALAVAWWYGLLQIAAATHPVSEAVAGCLLGTAGALLFLRRLEGLALRRIPAGALLLGLLAIGAATEAPRLPVEVWLDRLATALSGRPAAFAPRAWRD
ncbi:phosphoesterase [Azotobacter chroococcum]|uniref:phosphoesterase n=1 Tax=Azotobacter chroococcum TaxID=353 RepID=UPI00201DD4CD|nr:phosphoesterase [Azotobacter chroococcum]